MVLKGPRGKVIVVRQAEVINTILDLFSHAEHKIDTCGNSKFPSKVLSFEFVTKSILGAKNRGIIQRYLFPVTRENLNHCKNIMKIGEVHHMDEIEANFALNEKEFLGSITMIEPLQAIYSNVREIVDQQHSIFETLWNKSVPVEDIIDQIEQGSEPEYHEIISDHHKAMEIYIDLTKSIEKEALVLFADDKAMLRAERLGVIDYFIKASSEKGAAIKIVSPLSQENSEIVRKVSEKAPDIKILNGGSSHSGLLIVDNTKFLKFELKEPKAQEFSDAIGFIVYTNSKVNVNSARSFFELLWNEHIQYERFKEYEKQKETDKMKSEFINVAAHELRTPIQPILALSELLRSKTIQPHQFDEYLDIIIKNAKRLQRLAESILDVTKIESYSLKLNKEQINLNEMIFDVIQDQKRQVGKANTNIQLVYESDKDSISIEADKSRLAQVISNLLNNAIKFTREGVISVRATIKKELDSNEVVVVSVRDTGSGIDPEILPKLFSRFASKSFSGTGLGLFISRSIVEAHGGTIWAEDNSAGKGSTFSFSLPLSNFSKINSTSMI